MNLLFLLMLFIYLTTSIVGTKIWIKESGNLYNERLFLNVYKTGYVTYLVLSLFLFLYDSLFYLTKEELIEFLMFVIVASILSSNVAIFFVKDFVRNNS